MTGHFDLWPDLGDSSVLADEESRATHAHVFLSEHRFLAPHAIGIEHGVTFVRAEGDAEIVLVAEPVERPDRVGRNPKNGSAGFFEGLAESRKIDRFLGAARRVRLGIEIEDELASLEVGQRNSAVAIAGQGKGRSLAAFGQCLTHMPSFRRFQRVNLPLRPGLWAKAGRQAGMPSHYRIQVNQTGDVTGAGHTDKGMSDRA